MFDLRNSMTARPSLVIIAEKRRTQLLFDRKKIKNTSAITWQKENRTKIKHENHAIISSLVLLKNISSFHLFLLSFLRNFFPLIYSSKTIKSRLYKMTFLFFKLWSFVTWLICWQITNEVATSFIFLDKVISSVIVFFLTIWNKTKTLRLPWQ